MVLNLIKYFHTYLKSDFRILNELKKDPSVVFCKPDKGQGIVILDKHDYLKKFNNILDDESKFKKIVTDPLRLTLNLEEKINRTLRKLLKNKIISEEIYKELFSSGSAPGILYGLPKIHKDGHPIRPILAAYNSHNYRLGKFFSFIEVNHNQIWNLNHHSQHKIIIFYQSYI